MKIVTKRLPGGDAVDDARRLQRTMNRLRGNALVPRRVFRFASFEEADEWMMRKMAATAARQRSKTSSLSAES